MSLALLSVPGDSRDTTRPRSSSSMGTCSGPGCRVAWTPRLPRRPVSHTASVPEHLFSLVSEQTGGRSENAPRPDTHALRTVPCPTAPGDRAVGGEAAEAAVPPPEDCQPSHSWKPRSASTQ